MIWILLAEARFSWIASKLILALGICRQLLLVIGRESDRLGELWTRVYVATFFSLMQEARPSKTSSLLWLLCALLFWLHLEGVNYELQTEHLIT